MIISSNCVHGEFQHGWWFFLSLLKPLSGLLTIRLFLIFLKLIPFSDGKLLCPTAVCNYQGSSHPSRWVHIGKFLFLLSNYFYFLLIGNIHMCLIIYITEIMTFIIFSNQRLLVWNFLSYLEQRNLGWVYGN